jgi:DNA polymerase III subunit delta'
MSKSESITVPEPRANPYLLGHEAVEANFIHEFAQGRMHHAHLITGPKGIGKATLAFRLARHILSSGAQSVTVEEAPSFSLFGDEPAAPKPATIGNTAGDEHSPIFKRIASGSHADLLTLSPAYDAKKQVEKNLITVEEARQVPSFMSLTPAEGLWRVVIIDAVDQLNTQAANALLKILEEPPAKAILFLICHRPGALLPTIRSRCRLMKLSTPDDNAFAKILGQIAPSIETHEYAALYALAQGSPGHAITLYEHEGLKWYEGWLNAMMPDASSETRQKFADSAALVKAPASWAAIMHGWRLAMQRLSLYPHGDREAPIFRREGELLASIAGSFAPDMRAKWLEAGNTLIAQTETFHLDKRQSIRLLLSPVQLDMVAA